MEFFIFQKINFQIILVSTYEFIKNYIFDFLHVSENDIKQLELTGHIQNLETCAIFLAKVMLHNDYFYIFK